MGAAVALLVAIGIGAFVLLQNARPQVSYTVVGATALPTSIDTSWSDVLASGSKPTAILTVPTATPIPPSLTPLPTTDPAIATANPVFGITLPTATRAAPQVQIASAATAVEAPVNPQISRNNIPGRGEFSPPPELPPLSMNPQDHFWFRRPVDASGNSSEIFWYVYGSDGPENEWRVHHGVDLPNPLGKDVYAAGSGRVIWAADRYLWKNNPTGKIDRAYTYGNVVIVEHDFGYKGEKLFTLYAHLDVILVEQNERVEMGDVIGLSGNSGVVSGPHVHFEVRIGENWYYTTRNPMLWITPYQDHGVIAGRMLYANGQPVEDYTVAVTKGSRTIDTTTTYVNPKLPGKRLWNVVSDDYWRENFVIGDVPVGDYTVVANIGGRRFSADVTVRAGTTSFVELGPVPISGG